jgi:hypothetical protein
MVLSFWIDASCFPSETFVLLKLSNFNLEVCNAPNELASNPVTIQVLCFTRKKYITSRHLRLLSKG